MKTLIKYGLYLVMGIAISNCSGDDDFIKSRFSLYPEVGNDSTDVYDDPGEVEDFDDDVVGIQGYAKGFEISQDGNPVYREQYYYDPVGKLLKVKYLHPGSSVDSDFYYDGEGKLINQGNDSWNYKFYWENGRIIKADVNNPAWYGRGRVDYTYDDQGLLTTSKTQFENSDWYWSTNYTYFEDGNIKAIEEYSSDVEKEELILYQATSFNGYTEAKNPFYEVTIIPGQIVQKNFPFSKKTIYPESPDYETYHESYEYEYDTDGRVTAKIFGNTKVVYLYY